MVRRYVRRWLAFTIALLVTVVAGLPRNEGLMADFTTRPEAADRR